MYYKKENKKIFKIKELATMEKNIQLFCLEIRYRQICMYKSCI